MGYVFKFVEYLVDALKLQYDYRAWSLVDWAWAVGAVVLITLVYAWLWKTFRKVAWAFLILFILALMYEHVNWTLVKQYLFVDWGGSGLV